ncbi:hypothetical protein Syun_009842 [Stephania yunnanensis]|uniref:Lipase n=1 Tax=Stephania yunnanensis TaxID=152371 RepID=A0AAP0KGX9_9MAGN
MINTFSFTFLLFMLFGLSSGGRVKQLLGYSQHSVTTFGSVRDNIGLCKLRVEIYGYNCEEHTVTTQDGYILSLQRIPQGRSGQTTGDRPPVLLQHGVLMDGMTWLINAPDESLAYILADNGFDVWIANARGTRYSRGHTSLSPNDGAYWDWTWDQLVADELPAIFQYVHDQTGQKLHYVGHSLGTLVAFASFSLQMLLDKLRSAALLSPIAYLGHVSSLLCRIAAEDHMAEAMLGLGYPEFDPKGRGVAILLKTLCKKPNVNCYDLMTVFTGPNCCLNSSTVELFLQNEPQSTSTKNVIHLSQMLRGNTISMFDYGSDDENMKHYGQSTPPAYNMKSIPTDLPLYLAYGGQDALSDPNDVQVLLQDLTNHEGDGIVVQYREDYAHADYVMGVNAKQVVYDPMMAFFKLH